MRKLPNKNRWRVYDGSKIAARSTSKKKAMRQVRLLHGVSHGMKLKER